jgi:hypothetical protein
MHEGNDSKKPEAKPTAPDRLGRRRLRSAASRFLRLARGIILCAKGPAPVSAFAGLRDQGSAVWTPELVGVAAPPGRAMAHQQRTLPAKEVYEGGQAAVAGPLVRARSLTRLLWLTCCPEPPQPGHVWQREPELAGGLGRSGFIAGKVRTGWSVALFDSPRV